MEQEFNQRKKQTRLMILGVAILVVGLVGFTYAFFNYTRTGSANTISTGQINFLTTQSNTLSLTNVFPIASSEVSNANLDEVEIRIQGDTTYSGGEEFEITIEGLTNTIGTSPNEKTIPINFVARYVPTASGDNIGSAAVSDYYEERGSTTTVYSLTETGVAKNGKQILVGYIPANGEIDGTLKVSAYIDSANIAISDTYNGPVATPNDNMGTTSEWVNGRTVLTTTEWNALQNAQVPLSFKIKAVSQEGTWVEEPLTGSVMVQRAIAAKEADTNVQCSNITYVEDGITYLSGTNDCVDMNYIWYSGQLWRIVAIYPDGRMKLMTEDVLTSIKWGETVDFNESYVYQWLNEDFYDTLYKSDNIVDMAVWNYSMDSSSPPVRPETIALQSTVSANVGLLNSYEYYNAYRNSSYSNNYLKLGSRQWWLITPVSSTALRDVNSGGNITNHNISNYTMAIRPSIIIKSGLEFDGEGTQTSPYRIVGDKESAINDITLLNSRSVGEYVRFDNELYRIVDTNDGVTKLTKVNPINALKQFASSLYFGKSGNTQTDDYWDYYLNNTWYDSISPTYQTMLVDNTYYLGVYTNNYKETLCKDANLNNVTTKNCTKYTSVDEDKTFTGKVGLPRLGEMFSSQLNNSSQTLLFITQRFFSSSAGGNKIIAINQYGYITSVGISTVNYARPSITLNSTVKITGGTGYVGGDTNSPFEISE